MTITVRDTRKGLWFENHLWLRKGDILDKWHDEEYYNDDLTEVEQDKDLDIMEVPYEGKVLYSRKDTKKMTLLEIENELGYPVEIVE